MIDRKRVREAYERLGHNKAAVARELGTTRSLVARAVEGMPSLARERTRDYERILEVYDRLQNKAAVARELKIPRPAVQRALWDREKRGGKPVAAGRIEAMETVEFPRPKRGAVKRYILTSAQNNTHIHLGLWANLLAYAAHCNAQLLVSRYTYNRGGFASSEQKPGATADSDSLWYAKEILPHVCDKRVRLAKDLVFCGELNILPTAVRPLSGLETYTGYDSCIVPHAKIAMVSVPGSERAKLMYTTGTVTQRNYLQRKAGQKAEFHHAYAALIVEVDSDGDWFVRQLNANESGTFYDLDARAHKGKITRGHRPEAVIHGDIHVDMLEPEIEEAIWGADDALMNVLQPHWQVMHDVLDFRRRNHHDRGNPHKAFAKYVNDAESVEEELEEVGKFLARSWRRNTKTVVVSSNHDQAFTRWLREGDYRSDPVNAQLFLEGNAEVYRAIQDDLDFYAPEWGMRRSGHCPSDVVFLRPDQTWLLQDIQLDMHGHLGPNGYKGSPQAFVRLGRKAFVGHNHSACIIDGLYVVGVVGKLRMGYNAGPSSWSRTEGVLYPNGKRALITMRGTKWRAG